MPPNQRSEILPVDKLDTTNYESVPRKDVFQELIKVLVGLAKLSLLLEIHNYSSRQIPTQVKEANASFKEIESICP